MALTFTVPRLSFWNTPREGVLNVNKRIITLENQIVTFPQNPNTQVYIVGVVMTTPILGEMVFRNAASGAEHGFIPFWRITVPGNTTTLQLENIEDVRDLPEEPINFTLTDPGPASLTESAATFPSGDNRRWPPTPNGTGIIRIGLNRFYRSIRIGNRTVNVLHDVTIQLRSVDCNFHSDGGG
ncbi:MAG: hypothetical protein FWE02_03885 [Defluviitaleaceae bacterium]|nr:hypothetical protein [Defluviitaleaceae bacterium]